MYRGTGGSMAKAQAEFTSGVMKNETVRQAAAEAAQAQARKALIFEQTFSFSLKYLNKKTFKSTDEIGLLRRRRTAAATAAGREILSGKKRKQIKESLKERKRKRLEDFCFIIIFSVIYKRERSIIQFPIIIFTVNSLN